MSTFFSDYFDIKPKTLDLHGAFNVSIINDLPLFIDPFLLFNSEKQEYRDLHDNIIQYLIFLREKADSGVADEALLKLWYCFPEVKQNWLGFSLSGNGGTGLGIEFAKSLHTNLNQIFANFGDEVVTTGSHMEKVCLIKSGIGKDNISDFTTNMITDYLCNYTQEFALKYIDPKKLKLVSVNKAKFNYKTESWERKQYTLPWKNDDYVILTPRDMLTRDENWINRNDLINNFEQIPKAMPNAQLRAQISNYFQKVLARPKNRHANKKERDDAKVKTLLQFPSLIDYFIKIKEDEGDKANDISSEKVLITEKIYVNQLRELQILLKTQSEFYSKKYTTYEETHLRLAFLKDVIENKGGHKIFYDGKKAVGTEKDLQLLYRLVWYGTPSDVSPEAIDGRGPVDYKVSRGSKDKTLVEMKLAKNSSLERNLQKQLAIYQAASDAENGIKVILFFSRQEEFRAIKILKKLKIFGHKDIVLIDARLDNKPSGSKA